MKKSTFPIKTMLIFAGLFIGCTKIIPSVILPPPKLTIPVTPVPPASSPKDLSLRVVEFQTNLPVAYAVDTFSFCTPDISGGCASARNGGNYTADSNGDIFIKIGDSILSPKAGENLIQNISADKYWPATFLNYDTAGNKSPVDSAEAVLFPYAWVKVHFKNVTHNAAYASSSFQMHFDPDQYEYNNFDFFGKQRLMVLSPTTEPTIFLRTYAFVTNDLFVDHDTVDFLNHYRVGIYNSHPVVNKFDTLYVEIQF